MYFQPSISSLSFHTFVMGLSSRACVCRCIISIYALECYRSFWLTLSEKKAKGGVSQMKNHCGFTRWRRCCRPQAWPEWRKAGLCQDQDHSLPAFSCLHHLALFKTPSMSCFVTWGSRGRDSANSKITLPVNAPKGSSFEKLIQVCVRPFRVVIAYCRAQKGKFARC